MRLVCINKGKIKNLTEGITYIVVRTNSGKHLGSNKDYSNVWVINDVGIEKHYSRKRFITISESRNKKLNTIGI